MAFFSWVTSASVDSQLRDVYTSFADDPNAKREQLYLNYPQGQQILHDPKMGVSIGTPATTPPTETGTGTPTPTPTDGKTTSDSGSNNATGGATSGVFPRYSVEGLVGSTAISGLVFIAFPISIRLIKKDSE